MPLKNVRNVKQHTSTDRALTISDTIAWVLTDCASADGAGAPNAAGPPVYGPPVYGPAP